MSPLESAGQGMRCFKCGKLAENIHLCKMGGIAQIICDECCKSSLINKKCQYRQCGHYRSSE